MKKDLFSQATNPSQYDSVKWEQDGLGDSPRTRIFTKHILADSSVFQGKDILDVGSGTGWLLEAIHKIGARSVTGVEPSKRNVELAKKHHPEFETIHSSLEDFSPAKQFDVITCVHVMVHVADLEAAMKKMAALLREGGELFITIPDFEYARTPRYDYELEIEELNRDEYVISIKRPNGLIVDIIRRPSVYEEVARSAGLTLMKEEDIFPVEVFLEGKKDSQKFLKSRIATLLRFRKP